MKKVSLTRKLNRIFFVLVATFSLLAILLPACGGEEAKNDGNAKDNSSSKVQGKKPGINELAKKDGEKNSELASLSGKVIWDGDLPSIDPFPITKNPKTCGHEKKPSPRLTIDAESKMVKNVVIWLKDMPKGFKKKPDPPLLDQKNCEYVPHIIIVAKGQKLRMRSSDGILHNIHATGAMSFNKPFPLKDKVIKEKARRGGIAELNCDAGHSWMSAFIFVAEHPFYTITDDDGSFEFKDIPPGEHTLVIWHEGWTVTKTDKNSDDSVKKYHFDKPKILEVKITFKKDTLTSKDFKLNAKGFTEK